MTRPAIVAGDPCASLRSFTAARIALGHTGVSQPTAAQLQFQMAHAMARDAVHLPLDVASLRQRLAATGLDTLALHSAADSRAIYLQRPDLGRALSDGSRQALHDLQAPSHDVAFVIADGLSALAIERHALPLLACMLGFLRAGHWSVAPLAIVQQARVAIGDEIGQLLHANAVVVLIGERPGLSSPDSMGLYLTWQPRPGLTDERRNCISNVRPAGLSYDEAAAKLHYLLDQSRTRQLSGVTLKDETQGGANFGTASRNFLLEPPR